MASRKPPSPSRSNALVNLAQALVLLLFGAALVLGTLAARERGLLDSWLGPPPAPKLRLTAANAPEEPAPGGDPQWVRSAARLFDPSVPSRVIYLNREGAELRGGPDDSSINVSSVVVGSPNQRARLPAFAGTAERWKQIASCIRDKFAPFDVRVVEQRPMGEDYVMVMLGGNPSDLGFTSSTDGHAHKHSHATGLAPFNGDNIANAVVFVFTRALRESVKASCEAAGMEVAHAYGLDHARHCKDLMTYLPNCGPRTFLDKDLACGEQADRACEGKLATQNSYRRLMTLLGPPVAAATR